MFQALKQIWRNLCKAQCIAQSQYVSQTEVLIVTLWITGNHKTYNMTEPLMLRVFFLHFSHVTVFISGQDLHYHNANGGSRFDCRWPHIVANQKTSFLCVTFSSHQANTSLSLNTFRLFNVLTEIGLMAAILAYFEWKVYVIYMWSCGEWNPVVNTGVCLCYTWLAGSILDNLLRALNKLKYRKIWDNWPWLGTDLRALRLL